MAAIVVDSRGWLRGVKIGAKCVKYVWLSCPAWPSRWVLCISKQWPRLKSCHVACDECASGEICSLQHMWVTGSVMWAVASGGSLKFGVQGASATNWFSRVNGVRDNGIRLYWSLRCSWSIACRRCFNYIFILDLTPGFNGLRKDNCKMRRDTLKFWDLVQLILEVWQYLTYEDFGTRSSYLGHGYK